MLFESPVSGISSSLRLVKGGAPAVCTYVPLRSFGSIGEAFQMYLALAAEVADVTAGDPDHVTDTACRLRKALEFWIHDAALLRIPDGGSDGRSVEGAPDGYGSGLAGYIQRFIIR